jgi:hypothetical protein
LTSAARFCPWAEPCALCKAFELLVADGPAVGAAALVVEGEPGATVTSAAFVVGGVPAIVDSVLLVELGLQSARSEGLAQGLASLAVEEGEPTVARPQHFPTILRPTLPEASRS